MSSTFSVPMFITAVNGNTLKFPMQSTVTSPILNDLNNIIWNAVEWDDNKTEDENYAAYAPFAESIGIPAADPNSGLTEDVIVRTCTALTEYVNSMSQARDLCTANGFSKIVIVCGDAEYENMTYEWNEGRVGFGVTGTSAGHVLSTVSQGYAIGFEVPNNFLEDVEETFADYMQLDGSGSGYTLNGYVMAPSEAVVTGQFIQRQGSKTTGDLLIDIANGGHHDAVRFSYALGNKLVALPCDWDVLT